MMKLLVIKLLCWQVLLGFATVDAFTTIGIATSTQRAARLQAASSLDDDGTALESSRRGFFAQAAVAAVAMTTTPTVATAMAPVSTAATCDGTVSVWQRGNRLVYLLGTAHISEQSAQLASQLVRDTHPSAVFVELDLRRVAGGASVQVGSDGIVSTRLNVDPGAAPTSRVVIPQVVPVAERNGGNDFRLAVDASGSSSAMVSDAGAAALAPPPKQPSWFRRTLTDWAAGLVGKAIRGLYSNLGDAGFQPGEEFILAIKEGQAMGR